MYRLDINFLEDKVGEEKVPLHKRLQVIALNLFARLKNPEQVLNDIKEFSKRKVDSVKSDWEILHPPKIDKAKTLSLLKGKTEKNTELAEDILTKLETANLNEPQVYNSDLNKAAAPLESQIIDIEQDTSGVQYKHLRYPIDTLNLLSQKIDNPGRNPNIPYYLTYLNNTITSLQTKISNLEKNKDDLDDKPNNWGKVHVLHGKYEINKNYEVLEEVILSESTFEIDLKKIKIVIAYELRGLSYGSHSESPEIKTKIEQKALELKTLEKQIDILILDIQKSIVQKEEFLASLPKVQEAKSLDKLTDEVGKFYTALDNSNGDVDKEKIKNTWLACIYYLQQIDNLDIKGDNKKEFESLYKVLVEGKGVFKDITITKDTTVDERVDILTNAINLLNPDKTDLNKSDAALLKTNIESLSAQIKTFESINQELVKLNNEGVATYDISIEESTAEISLLETDIANVDKEILVIEKEINELNAQKDNKDPEEINKKRAELTEKKQLRKEKLDLISRLRSRQNTVTKQKSTATSIFENITAITQPYLAGYSRQVGEAIKVFDEVKKAYKYASKHSVDIFKATLEDREKREIAEQVKKVEYNAVDVVSHAVNLTRTSIFNPNPAIAHKQHEVDRLHELRQRFTRERQPMSFLADEKLGNQFSDTYQSLRGIFAGDGRLEGILTSDLMDYTLDDPELYNQILPIDLDGTVYFIPAVILAVLNILKPLKVDELITSTGPNREFKVTPGVPVKVAIDYSALNLVSNRFDSHSLDDLSIAEGVQKAFLLKLLSKYGNLINKTPKSKARDDMGASRDQCLRLAQKLGIDTKKDIANALKGGSTGGLKEGQFVEQDEKTGLTKYNSALLALYDGDRAALKVSELLSKPWLKEVIATFNVASIFLPLNIYGVAPVPVLLSSILGDHKWFSSKHSYQIRINSDQKLLSDPSYRYDFEKDIKRTNERVAATVTSFFGGSLASAKAREITHNNFVGNVTPIAVALITSWVVSLLAKQIRKGLNIRSIESAPDVRSAISILLANKSTATESISRLTLLLKNPDVSNPTPIEKRNLQHILSETGSIELSLQEIISSIKTSLTGAENTINADTKSNLVANTVKSENATVSDVLNLPITIDIEDSLDPKTPAKYRITQEAVDAIALVFPQESIDSLQSNLKSATGTEVRSTFYNQTRAFTNDLGSRLASIERLRSDYDKNLAVWSQIPAKEANINSRLNISGKLYQNLAEVDIDIKAKNIELDRLRESVSRIESWLAGAIGTVETNDEKTSEYTKKLGRYENQLKIVNRGIEILSQPIADLSPTYQLSYKVTTQEEVDILLDNYKQAKLKLENEIEAVKINLYVLSKNVHGLSEFKDEFNRRIRKLDQDIQELKDRSKALALLEQEIADLLAFVKQEDTRINSLLGEQVTILKQSAKIYKSYLSQLLTERGFDPSKWIDLDIVPESDQEYIKLPNDVKYAINTIVSLSNVLKKDTKNSNKEISKFLVIVSNIQSNIDSLQISITDLNTRELKLSLGDIVSNMILTKALAKVKDIDIIEKIKNDWDRVGDDILMGVFGYLFLLHKQFNSTDIKIITDFTTDDDFDTYLRTSVITDRFLVKAQAFSSVTGIQLPKVDTIGKSPQEVSRKLESKIYELIASSSDKKLNDFQKYTLSQAIQLQSIQPFPKSGKLLEQEARALKRAEPRSPSSPANNNQNSEGALKEKNKGEVKENSRNNLSLLLKTIRNTAFTLPVIFAVNTYNAGDKSDFGGKVLDGISGDKWKSSLVASIPESLIPNVLLSIGVATLRKNKK